MVYTGFRRTARLPSSYQSGCWHGPQSDVCPILKRRTVHLSLERDDYAENLIVVKFFEFYIKNRVQKLWFSDGILDPGWFRKVREACRNHFHLFSSKTLRRIPSYDQKTYNFHDY